MGVFAELPILIVDDDAEAHQSLRTVLRSRGFKRVLHCEDSRQVPELLARESVALVLLDLGMPHLSGRDLLSRIIQEYPEVLVSIITGENELETAVECMQKGAFDYLVKPLERSRLISSVQRAMELTALRRENSLLKDCLQNNRLKEPKAFGGIVTRNDTMLGLFSYIELIAKTPYPVFITGETGTGKELIAEVLHVLSGRAGKFIKINIAGLDENVFADTLFGHRKGAFTGAIQDRAGLLEKAAGGSLFLDEIGDLSLSSQVKLLR
ncbi:MAG TPA: sigma 54-interacting transcriptional regulator, partial [Candidatus Sulfotelmatobacter sp.]|nr:sigma 54-interacting transcriptional regulator [Candidatus Sulfotelmatobacter sp.]